MKEVTGIPSYPTWNKDVGVTKVVTSNSHLNEFLVSTFDHVVPTSESTLGVFKHKGRRILGANIIDK